MSELIENIVQCFSPEDVFSSVQSFLSSGYVFLGVVVILSLSIIKKIIKLFIFGALIGLVWFIYSVY